MADLTTGGGADFDATLEKFKATLEQDTAEQAEQIRLLSKEVARGEDQPPPPSPGKRYTPAEWAQKKARRSMARQSRRKQR